MRRVRCPLRIRTSAGVELSRALRSRSERCHRLPGSSRTLIGEPQDVVSHHGATGVPDANEVSPVHRRGNAHRTGNGEHDVVAAVVGGLELRQHLDVDGQLADALADPVKQTGIDPLIGGGLGLAVLDADDGADCSTCWGPGLAVVCLSSVPQCALARILALTPETPPPRARPAPPGWAAALPAPASAAAACRRTRSTACRCSRCLPAPPRPAPCSPA